MRARVPGVTVLSGREGAGERGWQAVGTAVGALAPAAGGLGRLPGSGSPAYQPPIHTTAAWW